MVAGGENQAPIAITKPSIECRKKHPDRQRYHHHHHHRYYCMIIIIDVGFVDRRHGGVVFQTLYNKHTCCTLVIFNERER